MKFLRVQLLPLLPLRLEIFLTFTHMGKSFLSGFLFRKVRKTFISVFHVKKRSDWLI